MTLDLTFRPIDVWPGELTKRRTRSPFRASYGDTLEVLERELRHLGAKRIVLQIALRDGDIRLDGLPRSNARAPEHPGVILAFESTYGPLKYATDAYEGSWGEDGWKANLRAIALGLEALRKVDRYGITRRGEQYTGWKALGAGIAMPAASGFASLEEAAAFLIEHGERGGYTGPPIPTKDLIDAGPITGEIVADYYRLAAKRLHPDAGGDPEQFKRLTEAKRMLDEARS